MKHTASAYRNGHCACDVCLADHRVRMRGEYAARAARLAADPSLVEHGRHGTYKNWGCRCAPCTAAAMDAQAAYRARQRERGA